MYLSQIVLKDNHFTRKWVSNRYAVHKMLRSVIEGTSRVLFRIDRQEIGTVILVQSIAKPQWRKIGDAQKYLAGEPLTKEYNPSFNQGGIYYFRLEANPTHRVCDENDGIKRRQGILGRENQIQWLAKKLTEIGAEMIDCSAQQNGICVSYKNENKISHLSVVFTGTLLVNDPERFRQGVERGIGTARGFGFGLLSLMKC